MAFSPRARAQKRNSVKSSLREGVNNVTVLRPATASRLLPRSCFTYRLQYFITIVFYANCRRTNIKILRATVFGFYTNFTVHFGKRMCYNLRAIFQ